LNMQASTFTDAAGSAPIAAITLWTPEVLAKQLVSLDHTARHLALGMAVQKGAPIDQCVDALVQSVELNLVHPDPLALQLTATALGSLKPEYATDEVQACLVALVIESQGMPIRISAVHAMFRLQCMPLAAHDSVCSMLFEADANARKVALLAFTPFALSGAHAIARCIAGIAPENWTSEALLALARSAGDNSASRRSVENFVMRSLVGTNLVPTGIAGYLALAQINPKGVAVPTLLQVAANTGNAQASNAALAALGDLGEVAQAVAKDVAMLLVDTDEPAREELLCRTLLRLKALPQDVKLAHSLQRVTDGPERSAAAHAMLICLHPKEFARAAADTVRQRFACASEALRPVLSQTYDTLTGIKLDGQKVTEGI
jgi:hypothetical protein